MKPALGIAAAVAATAATFVLVGKYAPHPRSSFAWDAAGVAATAAGTTLLAVVTALLAAATRRDVALRQQSRASDIDLSS